MNIQNQILAEQARKEKAVGKVLIANSKVREMQLEQELEDLGEQAKVEAKDYQENKQLYESQQFKNLSAEEKKTLLALKAQREKRSKGQKMANVLNQYGSQKNAPQELKDFVSKKATLKKLFQTPVSEGGLQETQKVY